MRRRLIAVVLPLAALAGVWAWQRRTDEPRANRLAGEKSPYLLQHAHNPVDWYPWGEEAFARASAEDKPIFVSIGYSTCHWCHVMERECFANPEIAAVLNRHFIAIKVDREERPDVDRIYMSFVMASTGHGGWPMSVWLTPERKPFFGGTYFPPDRFRELLLRIAEAWRDERDQIRASGDSLLEQLRRVHAPASGDAIPGKEAARSAFEHFRKAFDAGRGGFGAAPKFLRPVVLHFLLRYHASAGNEEALRMAVKTLREMAMGGIHDHLGGGFHRYSTDARWFVPHFEKMLYDQAQLAISYLEAFQITGDDFHARIARDTLDYVLREMTSSEGGFLSAEDADSAPDPVSPEEKSEGAYYLWAAQEIGAIAGQPAAAWFSFRYGLRDGGNVETDPRGEFKGRNILYQARSVEETAARFDKPVEEVRAAVEQARARLLATRARRPRPHLDDKVLTGWNGLMISAFARGGAILGERNYEQAARKAAGFLLARMHNPRTGVLLRRYRAGEAAIPGFLDDYAFFVQSLIDLYEITFEPAYLERAAELTDKMIALFSSKESGAFYTAAAGDRHLAIRPQDGYDGAEPSGNSIAILNLLRLAEFTDRQDLRDAAMRAFGAFGPRIAADPEAYPQTLAALDFHRSSPKQIILAGERGPRMAEFVGAVHSRFLPNRILIVISNERERKALARYLPVVETMTSRDGAPTAYVCQNYTCKLPTRDLEQFTALLR